jgi:hypothetical protein
VAHLHFPNRTKPNRKMQKSYQANAPRYDRQTKPKEGQQITAVWQNGGFSAKFKFSSSIELLYKTEHLSFDFRHFAKLQTVSCDFTETLFQTSQKNNLNSTEKHYH